MTKAIIGVDLGGTRIKVAALDEQGNLLHQQYTPTNDSAEAVWKQTITTTLNQLKSKLGTRDLVVGIAAPGIPNQHNSAIAYMPGRLAGLQNFEWSAFLQHKTWVINDGVAALMAEARLGVAKNIRNAVMLTLGTGVGGAILIDGKPYQGAFQKAGHIGHMVIDNESEQDVTGMPGSLENAIGNATVHQRSLGKYTDTRELIEAYHKGDHFASWVWLSSVKKLALGIASLTNILSPQCIILGGGITEVGSDLFEPLESFLCLYEWRIGGQKVQIMKAQFGDMAGAIGAACFALMKIYK